MTDSNILEMAKLGDPQAIEFLMNQSLQSRGMQAKVDRQGDCLEVTLEAERVPNRQALTAFVQKGINNLGAPSIRLIRIVGQQVGASYPAWMQELELGSGDAAPLLIQPETGSDLTVNQSLDSTLIQSLEDTTIQSREDRAIQDSSIQSLDELIPPDADYPAEPAAEPLAEPMTEPVLELETEPSLESDAAHPAPEPPDSKPGLEAGLLGLGAVGLGAAGLTASQPNADLERADLNADLWADEPQLDRSQLDWSESEGLALSSPELSSPELDSPETAAFLQDLHQEADSPDLSLSDDLSDSSSDWQALDQPAASDDSVLDFLNELTPDPPLEDFPAEQPHDQSAYLEDLAQESTTEADFQELIAASSDAIEPMPSELWADAPEAPSGEPDADLLDFLNQPDPEPLPESLNTAELLDEPTTSEPDWLAELAGPETPVESEQSVPSNLDSFSGLASDRPEPDYLEPDNLEPNNLETAFADYSTADSPDQSFDAADPNPVSEQQIEDLFAAEPNLEAGFIEEPLSETSYQEDLWPEQPPADNTDLLQALVEPPAEPPAETPAADLVPPDFMMEHDIEWDSEEAALGSQRLTPLESAFDPSPRPSEALSAEATEPQMPHLDADLSSTYPDPEASPAVEPDPAPASFGEATEADDPQGWTVEDPDANLANDPTEAAALPAAGLAAAGLAAAGLAAGLGGERLDEEAPEEGSSAPASELDATFAPPPDTTTGPSSDSFWTGGSDDDFEEIPPDFLQDLENESPEFSEFVTAPLPPEPQSEPQPDWPIAALDSEPAAPATEPPTSTLEADLNALELLPPEDFSPLELPPDLDPSVGVSAESDWGRLELDDAEPVEADQPNAEVNLLEPSEETAVPSDASQPPANLSQDTLEQGLGDFRQEFVEPLPDEFFAESASSDWQSDLRQPLDLETAEPGEPTPDNPPDYTPPPLPPDPSSEAREPSLLWALVPLSIIIGGVLGFMLLRSRMAPPPAAPPSESPAPPAAAPPTTAPPVESPASPTSSNPDALKTALDRADSAVTLGQTAQSVDDWKLVASRWQQAISLLETIPASSPDYGAAQAKRTEYQRYLTVAQARANQPIVAAVPLGTANIQTERPSPSASPSASPTASPGASPGTSPGASSPASPTASPIASPTVSPTAAVTCLPIASTATSQPVELSRLQFEVPSRTQPSPLIGCITNHTEQPIAAVNLAYSAPPARPATGKLSFGELNPKQTVPFKSEFALPPETQALTIAQISWTAAGTGTASSLSTSISVARTENNPS